MSMSTNSSSSSSTPTFLETPENSIIDQISATAAGLAGQMVNWANSVFAQTSQITNQAVGNFFNVSQQMMGLSNNLTGQYNNLFAPENAQLVADANSYASPSRVAVDMGQAGATQAQAGDQALKNSEEALRSFGINPSDGRYAALDKAAAVQNAANIAGAQNTQRNATEQIGRNLRSEAVQVGAQLPAAIANINNTAIQANTGASNASLANANTGANLMRVPNDFLRTAMDVKLPPTGQNSKSQSNGFSSSPSQSGGSRPSGGGGPGGSGGGNPFGPSGPAWMPQHNPGAGGSQSGGGGGRQFQPGSQIMKLNPGQQQPGAQGYDADPFGGYQTGTEYIGSGFTDPFQDYGGGGDYFGNSYGQDWGNGNTFDQGPETQSYTGDGFYGGDTSNGGGSDMSGWGAYNYDPSANQATDWGYNPYGSGSYDSFSGDNSGYDPSVFDGGSASDFGGGTSAFQDYGGGGNSFGQDYSQPDYGNYTAPSEDYDMGGAYAAGGPIPPQASPSGGRRVDDIPAQGPGGQPLRMNANEFVIPQDVALWKGQEFFQNLIDQSRKKRVTASAQPKPMQQPMR